MSPTRREVLLGLGGTTLAYAIVGCTTQRDGDSPAADPPRRMAEGDPRGRPNQDFDVRDWVVVSADGTVTAYSSRTEIGQGFTTVMHDIVGQALELPRERVQIVLGDTDVCPHHGPTTGSAATRYVGWAFWIACHQIKADLVALAAEVADVPAGRLVYERGEIYDREDPTRRTGIGELADGRVRRVIVDPEDDSHRLPVYVDRGTRNVNAEAIVTGTLAYAGDYQPEECVYGAFITPDHHWPLARLRIVSLREARSTPGVVRVQRAGRDYAVLAETYPALRRGLAALNPKWHPPTTPVEFDPEAEIRAAAELVRVVEEVGDPEAELQAGGLRVRETYRTQYMTQVPMETDTAVVETVDDRITVRMGNQNPFWVRHRIARQEGLAAEQVHVITTPAGGAFGSKADNVIGQDAVRLRELTDQPIKYVYSREEDIRRRGRFKEAVVFDIASAVDGEGHITARTIDIYQDEGHGTQYTYRIPHVRTRLFHTRLPVRHATMRGTSFVQSTFGMESHTDVCAHAAGLDPLEFRRRNVLLEAFEPLIDACGEMLDHGSYRPPRDGGVGYALCNHGGTQLGVVGAEVRVDRATGVITVVRLAGAFDFGLIINRALATNGVKSAMIWGLGAALLEEVRLDGHRCHTTGFSDYRIARMADTPPIEVAYFDNQDPGMPRGCGEMPLPPTVAAIANAVDDAVGIRFHDIPLTPERVRAALTAS